LPSVTLPGQPGPRAAAGLFQPGQRLGRRFGGDTGPDLADVIRIGSHFGIRQQPGDIGITEGRDLLLEKGRLLGEQGEQVIALVQQFRRAGVIECVDGLRVRREEQGISQQILTIAAGLGKRATSEPRDAPSIACDEVLNLGRDHVREAEDHVGGRKDTLEPPSGQQLGAHGQRFRRNDRQSLPSSSSDATRDQRKPAHTTENHCHRV
jgi:hypothetical protein